MGQALISPAPALDQNRSPKSCDLVRKDVLPYLLAPRPRFPVLSAVVVKHEWVDVCSDLCYAGACALGVTLWLGLSS